MFDTMTHAELYALAAQLGADAEDLAARIARINDQHDLMTELDDTPGAPQAARRLLASLAIAVAALYEKAEMHHAVVLACKEREAEAEQRQMESTDDEH